MLILVLLQIFALLLLLTFLWFIFAKGYKTKAGQIILKLCFAFLLIFFLWEFWDRILPENILGIVTDISRRLTSPDRTRTALLIRRQAFDLNFIVKVNKKILFYSYDYVPNSTFNWNEDIEWSKDSTLLLLSIYEPDTNELFKWAYDFLQHREILDANVIDVLWNERNKEPGHINTSTNIPPEADKSATRIGG